MCKGSEACTPEADVSCVSGPCVGWVEEGWEISLGPCEGPYGRITGLVWDP